MQQQVLYMICVVVYYDSKDVIDGMPADYYWIDYQTPEEYYKLMYKLGQDLYKDLSQERSSFYGLLICERDNPGEYKCTGFFFFFNVQAF